MISPIRWPALLLFSMLTLAPQAAMAVCGDSSREATEACDDGNTTPGDGCSAMCQVEGGFVCESGDFTLQVAQALPGGTQPSWTLAADRRGVTQNNNSVAGVYTTNMPADIAEIVFTLRVADGGGDDDFIGWTIGYDLGELSTTGAAGDRDFLYFNWKQAAQSLGGIPRPAGLWLSRVTGPVTDSGLWTSTGGSAQVATAATLGATGWNTNRAYQVRMRYSTGRIQIWVNPSTNLTATPNFVAANEVLQFDLTGSFPAGNFGFYTQSQEDSQFRLIRVGNGGLGADVCSVDSDGDGVKDRSDQESDGDGIPDLIEMPGFTLDPDLDSDLDGVADWNDPNHVPGGCTGTGMPARCATLPIALDRDQDGLPNHLDLDSDGDGLPDAYEAGLTDLNLNGLPDTCVMVNAFGACAMGGLVGAAPNADGDGLANFLDTDSDNDGLLDTLEGFDTDGDRVANVVASGFDTIRNGIDDAFDPRCTGMLCGGRVGVVSTRPDADNNGVHNYLQVCGDAYKIMAEGCDDGNTAAGDGCSAACAVETGYVCPGDPRSVCATVCGDGVVRGAEVCDDNNMMSGDGCSAMCAVEVGYTCPVAGGRCLTVDLLAPANMETLTSASVTYSGTATANAVVTVTVRDAANMIVETFTATAAANGTWSATRARADGSYAATASVTTTGGTYADAPNSFRVDATAPAVALTAPANNLVTTDDTPTVSGSASDAGGLAGMSPVTVELLNAQGMVVFTATPPVVGGAWSVDSSALPQGVYTVRATARDAAGNSATTPPRTLTVDTAAPTVALTAPAANARTNDATPTLSGSATDTIGLATTNAVVVTVRNAQGMVVFTSAPAVVGGAWSVDSSALAEGAYTVTAVATDRAGRTAEAGPRTFTVDVTAPALALVAPAANSRTPDATPALSGTAEVGATVSVTVRNAQGAVVFTGAPTVNAQGQWSVDSSALVDGDYTVSATATDAAGNAANVGPRPFLVDATAPSVALNAPTSGQVTNDNTPAISGVTEPLATVLVEVLNAQGMVVFTGSPAVAGGGMFNTSASMLADGNYTVRATVTDLAGNSTTTPPRPFRVDTAAPQVVIASPADGSISANVRPAISGTSEAGSTLEVEIRNAQGAVIYTQTVTADAMTGAWSAAPTFDLSSGQYSVVAVATDLAGNVSQPATNSFRIDTTVLPLDITAPQAGAAVADATPTLSGTTAPLTAVSLIIRDAAGDVVEALQAISDANGVWSVDVIMALADGQHVLTATVQTAAGVVSTDTADFTVDTVAPAVTLATPVDGAALNVSRPAVTGTSEAGAELQIELLNAAGDVVETLTATADLMGMWTATPTMALVDGAYTARATASDRAGNEAVAGPNAFTIDTTAPLLTIATPVAGATLGSRDVLASGATDAGQAVVLELVDAMGMVVATLQGAGDNAGAFGATFMNLANGSYTINATATDAAGNVTRQSVGFTVDSDEPELVVNSPTDMSVSDTGAVVVSGTASQDATVLIIIRDAAGNEVRRVPAPLDAQGAFSVTLDPALADGAYDIEVVATGVNGLTTSETRGVVVDTTAPITTISQPGVGAIVGTATPTITGTSEPGAVVTITIDGQAVGTATAGADGMWSLVAPSALADGMHTVSAAAVDAAGNAGAPVTRDFTVDTGAPMVTITSPVAGQQVADTTPTVTGTAEPGAVVTIVIDGQVVGTATAGADGMWSFEVPALTPGTHTVEARTTDGAGNMGSSGSVSFEVKTQAPVVIVTPVMGGAVTGPTVVVTGTGEPGATITVTVGGQTKTAVVGQDGAWTVSFDAVPAGMTTIEAGDGSTSTSVTVTVNDPTDDTSSFVLTGTGGCAQGAGGSPASGALWLLALGAIARRRRR